MLQKNVLITGANRGIGYEVAKQLLVRGFRVIVSAREEGSGLGAVSKLREISEDILYLKMDVGNEASIKQAFETFKNFNIKIDVLINNAAVLIDEGNILETNSSILAETFKINSIGPILIAQTFIPFLNNGGRIINVSSGYGSINDMQDFPPAYSISKAALNVVTKQLAHLLKDKNISVNSASPGWVRTEMGGADAVRSVEEGAETIVWLASEAPQTLTNKFIRDREELAW